MCEGTLVALTYGVRRMMLGVVVAKVSDAQLPVYEELTLACVITYPIKAHINRF